MGKTAKEIVGNADEIVGEMNKALADEWLAYMQYTFASKIVKAPVVIKELERIAKEDNQAGRYSYSGSKAVL